MTHGASIRSERNAARKVSVRQRPCGTLATSLRPRAQRPCIRVMLVLAQVSSMKTSREGSSRPWYFFHCARRLATSGRSCSLACRLFFEADPFVLEKMPNREVTHFEPALGQFRGQRPKRNVGLLGELAQQPVTSAGQCIRETAANLVGRRACRFAKRLRPLHYAGRAY